jgi:uncharacterized membrane protein YbhN (UPF0104 family)
MMGLRVTRIPGLIKRLRTTPGPTGEPERQLSSGSPGATSEPLPEELSPRHIRRRLIQLAIVGAVIGLLVFTGPGLGSLRSHLAHASPGWILAGVVSEVLSALCYVLIFRAVFCPRMSWRLSYQIGMSEQAANSVLSVSGAGGLALGAWALRRGGMSTEHIARRTVAFFVLTSLANVGTLIVFALLYLTGILQHDRNPALVYAFGLAALIATVLVGYGLPRLQRAVAPETPGSGRIAKGVRFLRNSLGHGVSDGLLLLREKPIPVLVGSFGVMGLDLVVLGFCFKAFGYVPAVGMLVVGYLIGQLGGNIPIPGGIVGLDAGLIGTLVLLGQPLAISSAAVLLYHAISLWIPALLGSGAFVQLRRVLEREDKPAALCMPLAEPIVTVRLPAGVGG